MNKKFSYIHSIKVIILALFLAVGTSYIYAYTAPTSTPPACPTGSPGCDAPLNVSLTFQKKLGQLWINTDTVNPFVTGLIVFGKSLFNGGIQIPTGAAVGNVLTSSDTSGNAAWQIPVKPYVGSIADARSTTVSGSQTVRKDIDMSDADYVIGRVGGIDRTNDPNVFYMNFTFVKATNMLTYAGESADMVNANSYIPAGTNVDLSGGVTKEIIINPAANSKVMFTFTYGAGSLIVGYGPTETYVTSYSFFANKFLNGSTGTSGGGSGGTSGVTSITGSNGISVNRSTGDVTITNTAAAAVPTHDYVMSSGTGSATALCTVPKTVVGGGCSITTNGWSLAKSQPSTNGSGVVDGKGWFCATMGGGGTIFAHAICQ